LKKSSPLFSVVYLVIFVIGAIYLSSQKGALDRTKILRDRSDSYSMVLMKDMGYGGLIHNFKNFLLRRDLADYQKAKSNVHNLQRLDALIAGINDAAILKNHADLMRMIEHYNKALEVIKNNAGAGVLYLDNLVQFNNKSTLKIIEDIEESNKNIKEVYDKSSQDLWISMVAFVVVCFLLFLTSIIHHLRSNAEFKIRTRLESKIKVLSNDTSRLGRVISKLSSRIPPRNFEMIDSHLCDAYQITGDELNVELSKLVFFFLLPKNKVLYAISGDVLYLMKDVDSKYLTNKLTSDLEKIGLNVRFIQLPESDGY